MTNQPLTPTPLPEDTGEARSYEMTDQDWLDLVAFMVEFLQRGGNPSIYQSKDGNALCLSLASGKERRRYWLSPDDDPAEWLGKAAKEWGVTPAQDNPIYVAVFVEAERTSERLRNVEND